MEFKVGDKVRLKQDLIAGQTYDGLTLLAPMYFSDVRTISAISTNGNYWLTEDPRGFCYAAKMLEYAPTYECGDIVKLSRPEELPCDYRYGISPIRIDNGETLFVIKEVRKNGLTAARSGEDGYDYRLCRINDTGTVLDIELRRMYWLSSGLKLFSKRLQYDFSIEPCPSPLTKTDLEAPSEKTKGDLGSRGNKLELSVHKKERKPIFNFKN